ncbi:DHH family phosphoesterase [Deinococcus radiophilus]|uniref:DHH family phosphoesterase n=1 Tax=Deinococcus radiophilus TaxID=32062 RepID=UPI003607557A
MALPRSPLRLSILPAYDSDDQQRPGRLSRAGKRRGTGLLAHDGPTVVLAHENPDGDAVGSVLGLTRALRELGREVYAPMPLPRYLQFLPEDGELEGL